MKTQGIFAVERRVEVRARLWMFRPSDRPSLLHWVTPYEIADLDGMLQRGRVPVDFEAKLLKLAGGGLIEQQIEKNCRLFIALLTAADGGDFKGITQTDYDRLLRVLAYVRKTDDAIPDCRDNGFVDDQQEVHAAAVELGPVLQGFKAWRLRHQVPEMWWTAQ